MTGNMTGHKLGNRYLVGERIGMGGMAEVYQGQDTVLGRTVAIKVMLPQYAEDAQFTARFRQEAASAANLQSPYIVNVYDWGQDNNQDSQGNVTSATSYIVMEFVRGSDLKSAIQERGAINQRKVAEIGSQVCQALSVAHGLDIIHRDIKPQNIMVQPDGNVKVMDFGIARAKNSVMQKTDAVLGTAHYISPEQAQGKELTAASDIYSLGVVLFEAVTGQLPFDGPDAVSVAMMQVNDEPPLPRDILPSIDPNLEAIICKAMAKNPRDRFATARDMRNCLNDFLAGRPVNIGGFSGAQTAVLAGAGAGAAAAGVAGVAGVAETVAMNNINPVAGPGATGGFQPDRTSVMPGGVGGRGAGPGGAGGRRNYVDPNPKKQGGGKKRVLIVAVAVLVIAAIAGLSSVLLGRGFQAGGLEVPDFTGKTLEQAQSAVQEAGFELGAIEYQNDDKVEVDKVISQTPRAGTRQAQGTKVTLVVSQGAERVSVPDLSNMTASETRSALQSAGLKYEAGAAEYSDEIKEGHVVRQNPKAGEQVDKGSTVTYYLSAGEEKVSVPNVVGALEGSAQSTLQNAGFTVNVDYQPSSTVETGYVVSQSPNADQKAKKNSAVSIVVSTGTTTFTVSAHTTGASGGSVSPESASVEEGGSATFYITTKTGYEIASVKDSTGKSYGTSSTVTVSKVKSDISLAVEFKKTSDSSDSPDKNKKKS